MVYSSGINQAEQQRLNRVLVLDLLRRRQCCSRADLVKASKLKRATITNIIGEFIDLGLVVETEILSGENGHRSIGLRINGRRYQVVGVMVTRTSYSLIRVGLSGEVYDFQNYRISHNASAEATVQQIKVSIQRMIQANRESRIMAIGVAIPGPYCQQKGSAIFVTNLAGWDGFPIGSKLQAEIDIPVFLENDANAAAYAQYWYSSHEEHNQDLAYIVAGQGIGCGLLMNGELVKGAMGIAGELGHTSICFNGPRCECGNRGCLELYCSVLALEKRIRARLQKGEKSCLSLDFTPDALKDALQQGDAVVTEEYRLNCEYLAAGIVNLVNQFNPSCIVIGDQLAEFSPPLLLRIVKEQLKERLRPAIWEGLCVEISRLAYNPIAMGAAAIAASQVLEHPFSYISG